MRTKDLVNLEEAYEKVLTEIFGFGKKKDDEHMVGVKFTNLLAKGLLTKGFKRKGNQFIKDNGHGMSMVVTMGGDYKETPVSVLVKAGYGKDLYKNWSFTAHNVAYPYRGDVSGADFADRKKYNQEDTQWEEEQRKKVGQIYDIVAAFEKADVGTLTTLLAKNQ
jgi:hypothetical protein